MWRHSVCTSRHEITKLTILNLACKFARKIILFFCLLWCFGSKKSLSSKCYYVWCPDVMSWRHKTWFTYLRLENRDMLESCFFAFKFFWFKVLLNFYLYDALTSWRHVMTSQNLIHLSHLVSVDVLWKWFFLCFHVFFYHWVWKFNLFFICLMLWRHNVMLWHHKTMIYLSQLVLESVFFLCFHSFSVHWVQNCYAFSICCHVMRSFLDVTKSASSISACGWARKMMFSSSK